jgi:hypothetical protein
MLAFVYLACRRVWYPYELEWLESGMVEHVRRLLGGHSTYAQPSVDFVTFPYPPMTTLTGALLSWPFGAKFWELRLVSTLASLGTFAILVQIVRAETKKWMPAFAAAGIYAASYRLCGAWFDVAKPDALFLFFCVAGVALLRESRSTRNIAFGGAVLGLAVMTKQTALLVVFALVFHLLATRQWRHTLTFVPAVVTPIVLISAIFMAISGRWYSFFVWDLLREHSEITQSRWLFITRDMRPLWFCGALIVVSLPYWIRRSEFSTTLFYACVAASLIIGAWVSRLHSGGYDNVLMPSVLAIALVAGISAGRLLDHRRQTIALAAIGIMFLLQLDALRYDVSDQVPTAAQRSGTANAIATIRVINGDVLVFAHPTYGVLAGKPSHASLGGVADVLRGTDEQSANAMRTSLDEAIHSGRFAAIALDLPSDGGLLPTDWQQYYVKAPTDLTPEGEARRPVTGWGGPPIEFWIKK